MATFMDISSCNLIMLTLQYYHYFDKWNRMTSSFPEGSYGLKGSMTQGAEWKHLLLFALPLMGGQALQQLYNTVDGIIVGNFVGDIALGAVGVCGPVTLLFISIAIGMCTGVSVVVSQYFGAGRPAEMRRAASTSIIMLLVMGLFFSAFGALFSRTLLGGMLGVGEWYLDDASLYFSIYAVGLIFQFAYNVFAALLRAVGDSKSTLYFLLVSSVVNLVLDLLFVIGFHWGVAGAAIATVISQAVSAVVALVYMVRKHPVFRFGKEDFRWHTDSAKLVLRLAAPSTLTQVVMSSGNLALQRVVNHFGGIYAGLMSGATAGQRVESFISIPMFAFGTAMSTFTGQNVGAGNLERVKRGRRVGLLMGVAVSLAVTVVVLLLRAPLISLFGVSEEGMRYGMIYLSIFCPGLFLFGLYIINNGILQGSGDVVYTAFILITSFALRIALAYTLAFHTELEYMAVWIMQPVGWLINASLSWGRYFQGGWKKKAITTAAQKT